MRTRTAWIAVGVGFAAIGAFIAWDALKPDMTSAPPLYTPAAWLPPEGYALAQVKGGTLLGLKWDQPTDGECRGSDITCFAVNVVTEKDCPRSLYMSITILNGMGENVGWTNDTARGVRAGEPVRMSFVSHDQGAKTARVAEINCY